MKRLKYKNQFLRKKNSISTLVEKATRVDLKFGHFLTSNFAEQDHQISMNSSVFNRCLVTGYGRNVLPKFRISHKGLKFLAYSSLLPGFKKVSW